MIRSTVIPAEAVLSHTLWNIFNDDVSEVKLPATTSILFVRADKLSKLRNIDEISIEAVVTWIRRHIKKFIIIIVL